MVLFCCAALGAHIAPLSNDEEDEEEEEMEEEEEKEEKEKE